MIMIIYSISNYVTQVWLPEIKLYCTTVEVSTISPASLHASIWRPGDERGSYCHKSSSLTTTPFSCALMLQHHRDLWFIMRYLRTILELFFMTALLHRL